jgi:hypothetical protein
MLIKNSQPCSKSELDLFTVPPTQIAIKGGVWDDVLPFPNYTNSISFNIAADSTHYLDLSQTELWVKLSLTKNNVAVTDYSKIGLVNNLLHSIFSQVQVLVNNVEVENTNSHYPYRAYLENLLSYGKEAKETFLQNEFFFKDKAGSFDQFAFAARKNVDAKPTTNTAEVPAITQDMLNSGLIKRTERFKKLKTLELKGPIHSTFFQ